MAYDLMYPLVTIYDEIEKLEHLSHATVNSYSMSQLVNFGLTIIKNTSHFETGNRTWIMIPMNKHMWRDFKTHFEETHCMLKLFRGTPIRSSTYHANILVSKVLPEVKSVKDNVLQIIETHMSQIDTESDEETLPTQALAVYATLPDEVQLEMLCVIKELQRERTELNKAEKGVKNSAQKNGDKKKCVRKNMTKYC